MGATPKEQRPYPHHARDRAAGDRRRGQILEAAIDELAERGWHAASVQGVAVRAGTKPPTVLHHFRNKPTLLLAALEHADAEAQRLMEAETGAAAPTGTAALDAVVAVVERYVERPALARLSIGVAQEATTPEHPAHDWARDRRTAIREALGASIAAGVADGELRADLDVPTEAADLFAVIEGAVAHWLVEPEAIDPVATTRRHVHRLVVPGG
ncbi:TetR/AcrR family transcriptional regulator [Egibacter rhizosphaerae]|uniref:TetR/AcrR family transcriptional regulator n=1 Tax=Egibacter rhizosphaerae TaxID=1670831 RepID=A0A411YIC3_9ACTN|nr:TetR/AcrR family transcriptional regulator [Egibacter rhizosphaerae]QBI20822.1 TetR/AcrR family transcriptional regulator [Egibacter rhizosphaerae]